MSRFQAPFILIILTFEKQKHLEMSLALGERL